MIDAGTAELLTLFLGADAATGSPRAILGFTAESAAPISHGAIMAAAQKQLARIAAHPMGGAPEAELVRLLVQEAAAKALTAAAVGVTPSAPLPPTPRPAPPAPRPLVAPRPIPPAASPLPPADPGLLADAQTVVGRFGGVTPEALQTLRNMAAARGLPAQAVDAAVRALAAGTSAGLSPPPRPAAPAPAPQHRPAPRRTNPEHDEPEEDPGTVFIKRAALLFGGILVALLVFLAVGLVVVAQRGRAQPAPPPGGDPSAVASGTKGTSSGGSTTDATTPNPASDTPGTQGAGPAVSPVPTNRLASDPVVAAASGNNPTPAALVRLARHAADAAANDPRASADLFDRALEIVGAHWTRLDTAERTAATEAFVDYFYRVTRDEEVLTRALAALRTAGAPIRPAPERMRSDQVAPAALAVGMFLRLTRERELVGTVGSRLDESLADLLGTDRPSSATSFTAGALLALRLMPLRIADPRPRTDDEAKALAARPRPPAPEVAAAFARWEEAVRGAAGRSPAEQQTAELVVLEGLERILTLAADPDEDRAVLEIVSTTAGRLRWREQEGARRRLVNWFDDQRISNADLHALTAAIVTRSSAENVDQSMVLSPGAPGEERAALKDAFAVAWGLKQNITGASVADAWVKAARERLNELDNKKDLAEALREAAAMAKLNEAAWRRQRGDNAGAAESVELGVPMVMQTGLLGPATLPGQYVVTFRTPDAPSGVTDGDWAVRFHADKTPAARLPLLREIESHGVGLGAIDADTLADFAFNGPSGEPRNQAQRSVVVLGSSPAMVNAILRALPRVPRNQAVASTIERVTGRPTVGWQSERWPLETRRAVVERLLETLAEDQNNRLIDKLAARIAESYASSVGLQTSLAGIPDEDGGKAAAEAVVKLMAQLRAAAEKALPNPAAPMPLERIDRKLAGRRALARGPVQQFAADQAACAELLAFVVSAEQPSRATEIAGVLTTLQTRRREAQNIMEQVRQAEAAMLKLWLIRAGEAAP